jgi:hypothetical protein
MCCEARPAGSSSCTAPASGARAAGGDGRRPARARINHSLLATVIERGPLAADGKSGSELEWVVLADQSRLVVKHVRPGRDWIEHPTTVVHGDLKLANLGLVGRRVVVLDWGDLTAVAPGPSTSPGMSPSTRWLSTPLTNS